MWLINTDGLFSIVKKDGDNNRPFCVRARVITDLRKFMEVIEKRYEIHRNIGTDYEFRIFISSDDLKKYTNSYIDNLNYPNFKNAMKDTGGNRQRLIVYHNIWHNGFGLSE